MSRNDTRTSATVRVFVPTYRRHKLFSRALDSLLAQTHTRWICEVHNDDPTDTFPAELVKRLGDPRIELHTHERNLGATQTFNLFFRPTREAFYSLLEDDNWWEPEFLTIMVSEMESNPSVSMGWCNQKIWEELPDGSWRDTHQLVTPSETDARSRLVRFGEWRQMLGAIHSNGSMLMRSRADKSYETPVNWPFALIEPFRERMVQFPLLYVPRPLAVFSLTLKTARTETRTEWVEGLTILAATFLSHAHYDEKHLAEVEPNANAKRRKASK